jgi:MFS family permease
MDALYRKVSLRLLPFLGFCYILAYLDRINIGFAKLQMSAELGFSEAVYGLGAGVFFIGYFIFEVPSNLILYRMGAKVWIARIMITWGLISMAMFSVRSPETFYFLRFLLGVAEAGFFPGIILYLTYWFPAERRGRINAGFMTAVALAGIIGGPVSGWILGYFDGRMGLAAWQWLFLLEGLPPVLAGLFTLWWLDDRIADARWLSQEEKALLSSPIERECRSKASLKLRDLVRNGPVWRLSLVYFCLVMGLYGLGFWLPTIIRDSGVADPLLIGMLSAIPYALAVPAMLLTGAWGDRSGVRRKILAGTSLVGAVGLTLSILFDQNSWISLMALSLATMGIMSALPAFWSLPTAILGGSAAAAGIAMINSLGNLAGFLSPVAVGWLKEMSGQPEAGMLLLVLALLAGAWIILGISPSMVERAQTGHGGDMDLSDR